MKQHLRICIFILGILIALPIFCQSINQDQDQDCGCFRPWESWRVFKDFLVFQCDEKSFSYPYFLITQDLQQAKIKEPRFYFELRHNMHICNRLLENGLNYKTNDFHYMYEKYKVPLPSTEKMEEVQRGFTAALEKNDEADQSLRLEFRKRHTACTKRGHRNVNALYDASFLEFIEGNVEEAVEYADHYLSACKDQNKEHAIELPKLVLLGQSYLEMAQFSQAIEVLSDVIQKDPKNKQAYFYRSSAYFELGNFDESLADYLMSDKGSLMIPKTVRKVSVEFKKALVNGLLQGGLEGAVEFIPSLCHSTYGLQKALWANAQPLDFLLPGAYFASEAYHMMEAFVKLCQDLDEKTKDEFVDELKALYQQFDQLNDAEKGHLIGHTIGKYSADIFAGAAVFKTVANTTHTVDAYRNLTNANRLCNLEAMVLSQANKEAIVASSLKHASEREAFLKRAKIEWDKQNKHIVGKHNYDSRKSIFQHSDPEQLLRKYNGKGISTRGKIGEPGYQEIVDFEEFIGYHVCDQTGTKTPTTWGKIHYSKNGAHIVPTKPKQ
jgi:tetratricopeptide (TPR) repeat protein